MIPSKYFLDNVHFPGSDDAVTEVLGFVTIIGILILSFSLIGLVGYPLLRSAQETRYTENTRQSFIVMAENINKIALGQAPSKSIELKMYGGRLGTGMDSTMLINATNSTKREVTLYSNYMGNIQNSIGDTVVAYEGTGVWVKYPTGTVPNIYRPHITSQSDVLIIPVVKIIGNSSMGGTGMTRIRAEGEPDVTFYGNMSNISITITGNYVSGWKDYFKNTMNWDVAADSTTVVGRWNTTTNLDVYILSTDMYMEII